MFSKSYDVVSHEILFVLKNYLSRYFPRLILIEYGDKDL